jgi:hypothetical protein
LPGIVRIWGKEQDEAALRRWFKSGDLMLVRLEHKPGQDRYNYR